MREKIRNIILSKVDKIIDNQKWQNKTKTKKLVVYVLVGCEETAQEILQRKMRTLIDSPSARACIIAPPYDENDENYIFNMRKKMESIHKYAAENSGGISGNLTNIQICPVVDADSEEAKNLEKILEGIDEFITKMSLIPTWQIFVLLDNSDIDKIEISRKSLSMIDELIRRKKWNRCCVVSNRDKNGLHVSDEQMLNSIAMATLVQIGDFPSTKELGSYINIWTSYGKDLGGVRDKDDYTFYSARSITLSFPLRLVMYKKMHNLISAVCEDVDNKDDDLIAHCYKETMYGKIIRNISEKLPMSGNSIDVLPLYSVMNGRDYGNRLEQFVSDYYLKHINGVSEKKEEAIEFFIEKYLERGGHLSGILQIDKTKEYYKKSDYCEFFALSDAGISQKIRGKMNVPLSQYSFKIKEKIEEDYTKTLYNYFQYWIKETTDWGREVNEICGTILSALNDCSDSCGNTEFRNKEIIDKYSSINDEEKICFIKDFNSLLREIGIKDIEGNKEKFIDKLIEIVMKYSLVSDSVLNNYIDEIAGYYSQKEDRQILLNELFSNGEIPVRLMRDLEHKNDTDTGCAIIGSESSELLGFFKTSIGEDEKRKTCYIDSKQQIEFLRLFYPFALDEITIVKGGENK